MRLMRRSFVLATAALLAAPAMGSAEEVSFEGQRIEWIVPFNEGGGTDTWARFVAPILSRHLPGEPTIIVRNMPGGGSILGANHFAQNVEPDGLTILGTGGSTVMPYLLGDPRVEFEYRDWTPILAQGTGAGVYTRPEMGVDGPEDIAALRDRELIFGSQGVSSLDLVALYAFRMLGLEVRPVFGMGGGGDKRLAFERGETSIDMQTTPAFIDHVLPMIEDGDAVPLWAWGVLDSDGELARDPTFPDIPHFGEAYATMHGEPPSGPEFEILKALITAGYAAQKFLFLPAGTPEPIAAAWREAAHAVNEDPEFKANAEPILGAYPQILAPEVDQALLIATNLEEEARTEVTDWLAEAYDYSP